MDEDEILSKITRLLERGCTMLATHHDCGAPLFRCQGEIVCPVCSFPDRPSAGELSPEAGEKSDLSASGEDIPAPMHRPPAAEKSRGGGPLEAMRAEASGGMGSPERADGAVRAAAIAEERMDKEVAEAKDILRTSLIARLNEISGAIGSEGDLDRLKKLLDCAEGLLSVLRLL